MEFREPISVAGGQFPVLFDGDQDGARLVVASDGDRLAGRHLIKDIRRGMLQLRGRDRREFLNPGTQTAWRGIGSAHRFKIIILDKLCKEFPFPDPRFLAPRNLSELRQITPCFSARALTSFRRAA